MDSGYFRLKTIVYALLIIWNDKTVKNDEERR